MPTQFRCGWVGTTNMCYHRDTVTELLIQDIPTITSYAFDSGNYTNLRATEGVRAIAACVLDPRKSVIGTRSPSACVGRKPSSAPARAGHDAAGKMRSETSHSGERGLKILN